VCKQKFRRIRRLRKAAEHRLKRIQRIAEKKAVGRLVDCFYGAEESVRRDDVVNEELWLDDANCVAALFLQSRERRTA
jgi:hypothetical protein